MAESNIFIGKQIGNYRIDREIASGGFGGVYLAQHIYLTARFVAIKMLHAIHLGSQEECEGFLQEAQWLEKLKHPHILPLYDVGIHEGIPYLIAEYAQNGSLRDRLRRRHPLQRHGARDHQPRLSARNGELERHENRAPRRLRV